MKVFAPALLAVLVAVTGVTAQKDGYFGARTSHRDTGSYDLEPPRPGGYNFFGNSPSSSEYVSQSKPSEDSSFFPSEHFTSSFSPLTTTPSPIRESKKSLRGGGGKTQYFSEAKKVPNLKPIFDAQSSEKKETKQEDDDSIKCVKIDKKKISVDDVFKGRFKRDTPMTCYKCEDLKNGGSYEKCSYGTDPKNKAFFVSHQKSYSSNDKPVRYKFGSDREEEKETRTSPVQYEYSHGPSSEYLASAASVGRDYKYDGPSFSSSNNNEYRYGGGPSHSSSDTKFNYSPESSYDSGRDSSDYTPKSSEYNFSSSKKEPTNSYSYQTTDKPVKYSYSSSKEDGAEEPESKYETYAPKSTKYSYKTTKVEPTRSYSFETTSPPESYSYNTERSSDDETPKHAADDSHDRYTSKSKPSEYSFSSSKKEPTKSYSYETTDKPISYSYKSSKEDKPKHESHDRHVPKSSEYKFSKSVEDPLKTYYESSSYSDDEPQQSKQNSGNKYEPTEYSYSQKEPEPEKSYRQSASYNNNDQVKQKKPKQQQQQQHAPQVKEYTSSESFSIPDTFIAEPSEELKKALGEFHQKDRSHCKKIQKDKMTCWQCVDKSGAQQEECMYIASSEPKKHQTAYSDVKEYTSKPEAPTNKRQVVVEKRNDPIVQHPHGEFKEVSSPRPVRRRVNTTPEPEATSTITSSRRGSRRDRESRPAATSEEPILRSSRRGEERGHEPGGSTRRRAESNKRRSANPNDQSKKQEPAATPKPKEFQNDGPEGAFSEDTIERFDPVRGVTLPAYMLSRSILEEQFDESVRNGR